MRGEDYRAYVLVGAGLIVAAIAFVAGLCWLAWTYGRPWLHEVTG